MGYLEEKIFNAWEVVKEDLEMGCRAHFQFSPKYVLFKGKELISNDLEMGCRAHFQFSPGYLINSIKYYFLNKE